MREFWFSTFPVPVWLVVLIIVVGLLWQWMMERQASAFRDLMRDYWRECYTDDVPPTPGARD